MEKLYERTTGLSDKINHLICNTNENYIKNKNLLNEYKTYEIEKENSTIRLYIIENILKKTKLDIKDQEMVEKFFDDKYEDEYFKILEKLDDIMKSGEEI